jgi:L-threonylcarbamoyladenylate synthase
MADTRTRVLRIATDEDLNDALAEAADVLRSGGLVAFPTETVYGLGADATNPRAVQRIFEAKGRPATNPLIVHAHDEVMARRCVSDWPARASVLAERFWPGPLTIVLPRSDWIAPNVAAGLTTIGVRVPANSVARALIREAGGPIAAPSANRSTGISPTQARHVMKHLADRIDLVLDAGPTRVGIESTVVDAGGDRARILRPGHVTAAEISRALGEDVESAALGSKPSPGASPASPGQMPVHYAPGTPSWRVKAGRVNDIEAVFRGSTGLLVLGHPRLSVQWTPRQRIDLDTLESASHGLYDALHRLDELGLDDIVIVLPPTKPEWAAVADRVWRASRCHDQKE